MSILQSLCLPTFTVLLFLILWFQIRNIDPLARRTTILIVIPLLIGLAIAGLLDDVSFMVIGFVFSGILWAWFTFLRFPASYRMAYKQVQIKQLGNAQQLLNQTIQERPEFWEAYQLRSMVNASLGYFTNAERDARKAIDMDPQASINYHALGNVYWQQGDFEKSRHAYLDAYRRAPKSTLFQYNLGVNYYKLELYEDARNFLAQASKARNLPQQILPQNCLFLFYYLAQCEELLGNSDKSRKAYKQMKRFGSSIDALKEQLNYDQPTLRESMKKDVEEIERILNV